MRGSRVIFHRSQPTCGVFSKTISPTLQHQLGGLQFNAVLTLTRVRIRLYGLRAQPTKGPPHQPPPAKGRPRPGRFSRCTPKFVNSAETLPELTEALYFLFLIYYKSYKSGTAQWKGCAGRSRWGKVGNSRAFSGYSTLPAHWCLHQLSISLNPEV